MSDPFEAPQWPPPSPHGAPPPAQYAGTPGQHGTPPAGQHGGPGAVPYGAPPGQYGGPGGGQSGRPQPGQYAGLPGQHAGLPGQYAQPGYGYPAPRRTNALAVAAMIVGILWLYWIGSVLALVFGYVARAQIKRSGEAGNGMALAGIVLGWIGVGIFVLLVIGLAADTVPIYN